jgi:hypothetical protein
MPHVIESSALPDSQTQKFTEIFKETVWDGKQARGLQNQNQPRTPGGGGGLKSYFLCNITPFSSFKATNLSEVHDVYIFRVEEEAKQETNVKQFASRA